MTASPWQHPGRSSSRLIKSWCSAWHVHVRTPFPSTCVSVWSPSPPTLDLSLCVGVCGRGCTSQLSSDPTVSPTHRQPSALAVQSTAKPASSSDFRCVCVCVRFGHVFSQVLTGYRSSNSPPFLSAHVSTSPRLLPLDKRHSSLPPPVQTTTLCHTPVLFRNISPS